MSVVADASPLIILAKIGGLDLLHKIFPRVYIAEEVYAEVVISGAGLPGASEVADAGRIEVKALQDAGSLAAAQERFGLGLGELATILLAKEIDVSTVLMDEERGRQLAREAGLQVRGTVGILENLYQRGEHYRSSRKISGAACKTGASRLEAAQSPRAAFWASAALDLSLRIPAKPGSRLIQ